MPGNSFGHAFRFTTWGESHGPEIGCVVDGVPPRLALDESDIQQWLDKRRPGQSRHTTQRREPDQVAIVSGVFEGQTTGTPIALIVNLETVQPGIDIVDLERAKCKVLELLEEGRRARPVGHVQIEVEHDPRWMRGLPVGL